MRLLVVLGVLTLLTACGGNNSKFDPKSNPDPDGDGLVSTSQVGILLLLDGHLKIDVPDVSVKIPQQELIATYVLANFQAFPENQDLPLDPLGQVFDTCFVSNMPSALTAQQVLPELPELPELPALPISEGLIPVSAGSELALNNGSSLYTKLLQQENGNYVSATLPNKAPQDLTVTIPGKAFPAFKAVALPEGISDFSLSSSSGMQVLSEKSIFRWSNTASKDTFVLLLGVTDSGLDFACYAKDDGSFTFPHDSIMAKAGFSGRLVGAARIRYHAEYKNSSMFMPMRGFLELYPAFPVILNK